MFWLCLRWEKIGVLGYLDDIEAWEIMCWNGCVKLWEITNLMKKMSGENDDIV